jgi:hypothetical protein
MGIFKSIRGFMHIEPGLLKQLIGIFSKQAQEANFTLSKLLELQASQDNMQAQAPVIAETVAPKTAKPANAKKVKTAKVLPINKEAK